MNHLAIQNIAHTVGTMKDTMSSLEIAKLTGKRHDNVMRDIRVMLENLGEGDAFRFEVMYKDAYGRDQKCYNLPKRECLILAGGYDVVLRASIIDRWAELEYKEQAKVETSPRVRAIGEWKEETELICSVLDKLGYAQGYLRKEALEIGFRIEGETGEHFLPNVLVDDPQAIDPQRLNEHTGTHAAFVAMGSQGSNASAIAQVYGKDITPTNINNILVNAGLQVRISSGKYTPTEKGKVLCNQSTLASGKLKGSVIIKDWLYNSNKSLRDLILAGVQNIRAKNVVDKR